MDRDLRFHLHLLDAMQGSRKMYITCYNQGEIWTFNVIKKIPVALRNRLMIFTYGPTKDLPKKPLDTVTAMPSDDGAKK